MPVIRPSVRVACLSAALPRVGGLSPGRRPPALPSCSLEPWIFSHLNSSSQDCPLPRIPPFYGMPHMLPDPSMPLRAFPHHRPRRHFTGAGISATRVTHHLRSRTHLAGTSKCALRAPAICLPYCLFLFFCPVSVPPPKPLCSSLPWPLLLVFKLSVLSVLKTFSSVWGSSITDKQPFWKK